jgi:GT2 family glycosyltransferase
MGPDAQPAASGDEKLPLVSLVFLAFNRRERVLTSLRQMLGESGYPRERLEPIVVDNGSTDGTAQAVEATHPEVRIIRNGTNLGAPGLNRGFAVATGDYVLILDDDAYLEPGGLARAVRAAEQERADLVSFTVVSSFDPEHPLNDDWRTGLFSFWGCAALVGRQALETLGGYDPNMFIWANEVDFTMRLLDLGFRHLYLPDVRAVHMKERIVRFDYRRYLVNARHHAYIAAKLMAPLDGLLVVFNIAQRAGLDALTETPGAIAAVREAAIGYGKGLSNRRPVRPSVSRAYRRHFAPFVSPWKFVRSPAERLRGGRGHADPVATRAKQRDERRARFFADRPKFYPETEGSLRL